MEYTDEEIMKARKRAEETEKTRYKTETVEAEKKQSIYDEFIEIFQIPTVFTERKVLDGRVAIRMPVDFELRPQEEIKILYPNGSPPQELYGNSYAAFTLALNWTQQPITSENMPEFMPYAKKIMERMGPGARVLKTDIKMTESEAMGIMEVAANAIDGVSYSYIFYTIVEGRLLISNIMFERKYLDRLKPIAKEMAESFYTIK